MSFSEEKRKAIQLYMLEKIRMDDTLFLKKTAEVFSISETSVRRYVKMCIDKKLIEVSNKNQCGYRLVTYEKKWSVSNDGTLEEDQIFYAEILPELKEISKNAKDIWAYTFAEIMNNAIEHSEAEKISYAVKRDCLYTEISIVDDGIGVFKNIQKYLLAHGIKNVSTEQAVLELYIRKAYDKFKRTFRRRHLFFIKDVDRVCNIIRSCDFFHEKRKQGKFYPVASDCILYEVRESGDDGSDEIGKSASTYIKGYI